MDRRAEGRRQAGNEGICGRKEEGRDGGRKEEMKGYRKGGSEG